MATSLRRNSEADVPLIYKIVSILEWRDAEAAGRFDGSAVDRRDGYMHFSSATQVEETAARHFAGRADLLLVAVDEAAIPVRWEPSRGGALFPHLYQPLPMTAVRWTEPLVLSTNGRHLFPIALMADG